MKKILFTMLAVALIPLFNSCSNDEDSKGTETTPDRYSLEDFYSDYKTTGIEKALLEIDKYNEEYKLLAKPSTIDFVATIDDCPAQITQSVESGSNIVVQKMTTYCRVITTHKDDYIPSPDYLSRHYNRTLNVARQEIKSTVVRQFSDGKWSDWTYLTDYYKTSHNHGKNIAFFGGSFAHNLRDAGKGENRFGFDYNGDYTSMQNLIAEVFACKHTGNYAQGGHGVFTGSISASSNVPYFKYNTYEQIKYAFEFSEEKDFVYDIFLLFGGINDSSINVPVGNISDPAGDYSYTASFKKAIEFIKEKNPDAEIYILTSFPSFNGSTNAKNKKYIDACIGISEYYDLPILDIYNNHVFTDDNYESYYLSDKIHPNGNGYKIISPYIINLLNR